MNEITAAQHYSDLEGFYKRLSADSSIHLPLWLEGTRSLQDANRNAQELMGRVSQPRPGQRLLDAGCGLGATSIWLARKFGVHVLGVSNSASNIEACRRAAAALGTSDLTTFETRDLNGDFADPESFDFVWNLESLNYLPQKQRFIERVSKVLKPGGLWLSMDRYLDTSGMPTGDSATQVLTGGFYRTGRWEPVDSLRGFMAAAGLEEVHFTDLTPAILAAPRSQRVHLSAVPRAALGALRNPRSFRAMLRALRILRASYNLMQRGAMTYGLLSGKRPESRTSGAKLTA